jgi:arginine/lysine/ornithine decarboxylase
MLYDKLKNYAKSDVYPFHMPGHKRNISSDFLPYNIDLTEINGFDNLHGCNGCIKEIADKAAKLYSAEFAYLLINGATGGILAAIRSMTNYGDKVIVARNCHKSVYNAVELCGLDAIYALPEIDVDFGVFSSVKPQQIEDLLSENDGVKLVVITSPTYEGVVSDIRSISEICHKHGAKLFVDEAHGAHFPFSDYFPENALKCKADVVVTSLHKTLPSLTQTALLLTNDFNLTDKIEENLSIFESSSPSYILMSAIEKCLDFIENNQNAFETYTALLNKFYSKSLALKKLNILCSKNDASNHSFFDFDKSKIIISTKGTNISGVKLAKILRDDFSIETEMAYTDYVIAMTSVCDSENGFNRLINALLAIDASLTKAGTSEDSINYTTSLPEKVFNSANKYSYKKVLCPIDESIGKISLDYVWAYPPGIPLLVAGEKISENEIKMIKYMQSKTVEVYSSSKSLPNFISVAQTD